MTAQRTDGGRTLEFRAWTLPLIVLAIAVPIVGGFVLGGPLVGLPMGFAVAAAIVVLAARQVAEGPIETARSSDERRRVLVVVSHELDDPAAIERVKSELGLEDDDDTQVLVMAPAQSGLLDRWASDVRRAREEAQRKLVLSLASLGKAGVVAEPTLGDQSIVQAVEDQLREFAATEVVLVTGTPEEDPAGDRAAGDLARRLQQPFSHIAVRGPIGAGGGVSVARPG